MTNGNDIGGALDAIIAERATLEEWKKQIASEVAGTSVVAEQMELRRELIKVTDRIRALAVREHELRGTIKRAVGARAVKCPTCDRFLPKDTLLSSSTKKLLTGNG